MAVKGSNPAFWLVLIVVFSAFPPRLSLEAAMAASPPQRTEMIVKATALNPSFNPTRGEMSGLFYFLTADAHVTTRVFDADHHLVKTIVDNEKKEAGPQRDPWDGTDMDGEIVPDEAYFLTIEADDGKGRYDVYDPTTFSGGEEFDITVADINRLTNTITYTLPFQARMLIRIGIAGGPLLRTLVDWEPRIAGEITEYWNGMDRDNLVSVRDRRDMKMIITGFALPQNSIITYGREDIDYRQYKANLREKRPLKATRGTSGRSEARLSIHYGMPRTKDHALDLIMSFPGAGEFTEEGLPIFGDRALVRVAVDERDKAVIAEQQYEISFYLDMVYYAEEEVGNSPCNWLWNLSNVSGGEHVLTANMATFNDQVGVVSRRIIVKHK